MYYWCSDFMCLYFLKFFHRVLGVVIVDYIKPFLGQGICWLLSTQSIRTRVGTVYWKMKNCKISFAIASYVVEIVGWWKQLHRSYTATIPFRCEGICFRRKCVYHEIFATGTCRPSYLPCTYSIFRTHAPEGQCGKLLKNDFASEQDETKVLSDT